MAEVQLDEMNGPVLEDGLDTNVIAQKIQVTVGWGSTLFQVLLFVLGIIPGIVFLFMKVNAKNYFRKLQQNLQARRSTIDNLMEQRVQILQNLAGLLKTSVELDKETYTQIAAFRGGINPNQELTETQSQVDNMFAKMHIAMEQYPELQAHADIRNAMQQNSYLQREITAARELYNDVVNQWNNDIFSWPTKQIVAAKAKYTTVIPFAASQEVKRAARQNFF